MKITCQACQAKYTIADEKVTGKVVKIRCKKCGASIVVNGNQTSPDATQPVASAGIFDSAPPGDAWTVNVAEGDQRTMTQSEIVAAYATGVVTDEMFCWKEGMADWLPLQEIAPLLAACKGAGAPPAGAHSEGDEVPTRIHDPSTGPLGMGAPAAAAAALRKDGNGAGAAPSAPAARRAGGRGAAADLFGAVARAGGEDEVLTSAPPGIPQAHVEAPKPIGARNESSLLFAAQEGNAPAAPSMTATSEASGLIDIRQLSAQMRSSTDDSNKKKSRVEDIMNLGGGGAFSPSLAAPILSAPSLEQYSQPPPSMVGAMGSEAPAPRSKALVFLAISAGLFFLVAAASVALLLLRGKGVDEGTLASAREPAPAATASGATAQGQSARGGETPQASAPAAPEATSATPAAAPAGPPPPKETAVKEAKESTTPAPTGPREAKPAAPAPPKEAAPAGAAEFNMGEARARLASIAGGVQSCKRGDTTGGGKVEIVFAPSGAVQSASLMPGSPFDGAPTGKCVEARFRAAHVPPFGGSPFTVSKSFSIN